MRSGNGIYRSIIFGTAMSLISSILFAALGTVFLDNESLAIDAVPYISFGIWIVAGFLGSYLTMRVGEGKWLLRGGLTVFMYYVILLAVGILVFDGLSSQFAYGVLGVLIGFGSAVILISKGVKGTKAGKIRKFKMK